MLYNNVFDFWTFCTEQALSFKQFTGEALYNRFHILRSSVCYWLDSNVSVHDNLCSIILCLKFWVQMKTSGLCL